MPRKHYPHPSDGCITAEQWMTPHELDDRECDRFARHDAFIRNARFEEYREPDAETAAPIERKENVHE